MIPRVLLALSLAPALLAAQEPADPPVIRGVVIERGDVFEPDEEVSWFARAGNALHATTRRRVVERELLFRPGDRFDSARVAETARNLRGLGIFRRVIIDSVRTDSGLVLRVTTKDGWSTRPTLDFSSTAGQTAWAVGLEELNLFGNAAYGSLTYSDHPDRRALTALFRQPRLVADRVYLQLGFQQRSDGRSASFGMGQPFLSLSAPAGFSVGAVAFSGDVLRFADGDPTAFQVLRRHYLLVRGDAARALTASPRGFVRLGLLAQLRRDDFVDTSLVGTVPFPRSVTGAVGPYLWLDRASFLVVHNFRSFLREEDVDLSPSLVLGTYAAPGAFGYERGGLGLQGSAHLGIRTPGGFAAARATATGLYGSGGLDSGTVRLAAAWLVQPARLHMLVLTGEAGWQRNQVPGEEFDLGLLRGPRAFYAHAFTGDRLINFTAEYRWTVAEDLWSVLGIGFGGFFDYGGAWYAGSPRRTGSDAGIGLRLGPSRSSGGEVLSIDLARRFETDRQGPGWAIVVRRGVRY